MRDDEHHLTPTATGGGTGTPGDAAGVVPDAPWLHGTWQVARVDGEDLAAGVLGPPWLTFDGDGVVFGYAGVNRVRGTWRLDGGSLVLGPVVATLMAGPAAGTATERAVLGVLGVLQDGGTVAVTPGTVTVRSPTGRTADLVRSAPQDPGSADGTGEGGAVPHALR